MQVKIHVEDPSDIITGLARLDAHQADRIQNYAIAEIGKDFAEFEKSKYLSGQYLSKRTGETYRSVKFYKIKNNKFGVSPGVGIVGRKNYLNIYETGGLITPKNKKTLAFTANGIPVFARSVYIEKKPFVSDAKSAYDSSGRSLAIMRTVWSSALRKKGLML